MENIIDMQTAILISEGLRDTNKHTEINLFEHEGVYFSDANIDKSVLERMPSWEARKDDVFIVSFPKAGTTWTQEIMYLALNEGDVGKAQLTHTIVRVPYMEVKYQLPKMQLFSHPLRSLLLIWCLMKIVFRSFWQIIWFIVTQRKLITELSPFTAIDVLPSPRFLKSHLPIHLLPRDIFHKKAKVVYVARNPKDLAVSYYYFHRWQPLLQKYESWDTFFDDFINGKINYGKWYDHYLGYWKRRHEENVLFLKYEDMKRDEKAAVKEICEFLGYQYSDEILERITQHSTFDYMKKHPMTNPDALKNHRQGEEHISFMRKGIVGDWKSYFTVEQNKAFDALIEEKLAGTGLEFNFE